MIISAIRGLPSVTAAAPRPAAFALIESAPILRSGPPPSAFDISSSISAYVMTSGPPSWNSRPGASSSVAAWTR